MFGKNPIRPPVAGDGMALDVQHIFPTLQGEGPLAGMPAVFIRLGGCNLACNFCDTEFESYTSMKLEEILEAVRHCERSEAIQNDSASVNAGLLRRYTPRNDTNGHLIVLTGGEPLRQNISPLCDALLAQGFQVQIETNGTLWRPLDARVLVVCSPKVSKEGYHRLRDDLLARTNAIKFIVSASRPHYRDIADIGQEEYGIPVYIQPMDEYDEIKNLANRELAVALAMKTGGRLSVQLHKILGIE